MRISTTVLYYYLLTSRNDIKEPVSSTILANVLSKVDMDELHNTNLLYFNGSFSVFEAHLDNNSTSTHDPTAAAASPYFFALFVSESALGIILNILTIFIIRGGKHIGKAVHLNLINLAIANILRAVTFPLLAAFELDPFSLVHFPNSSVLCKLYIFFVHGTQYASAFWSVVISVERFVVIFFPLKALSHSIKHKVLVVVGVWICCYAVRIDSAVYSDILMTEGRPICQGVLPSYKVKAYIMALSYYTPALIIVVMYSLIIGKQFWCRNRSNGSNIRINEKKALSTQSKQVSFLKHSLLLLDQ